MVKVQNFSENLEKSFSKLGAAIEKEKKNPEMKDEPIEKVVKKVIQNFTPKEEYLSPHLTKQKKEAKDKLEFFLPSYLDSSDERIKEIVKNLVLLALKSGIEEAIKESRRYPPFIIDAFHDALVDKIIPELKRRNLI